MAIEVITAPAEEPVSLQEAKDHLRVEVSADDSLIARLITDAREWSEWYTRRALVTQTWKLWCRQFPGVCTDQDGEPAIAGRGLSAYDQAIVLPGGKVSAVTAVSYVDTGGVTQTLDADAYALDAKDPRSLARLVPAYGMAWPSTRDIPNAVSVAYQVGYGGASAVPAVFKQAILLHVGWSYENREPADREGYMQALETKLADSRLFTFA